MHNQSIKRTVKKLRFSPAAYVQRYVFCRQPAGQAGHEMIGHEGKDYGYDRLFEAVRYKPHTVPALVRGEPELLECTNYSGETVLHWFVVENDLEVVELLRTCGAQIPPYALSEACGLGYLDMVYLLLGLGVEPELRSCRREVSGLPKKTLLKFQRAFKRYGYDLDEET